ncbi:hypothetical protein H8S90_17585 [Olivibacter sp. SDN3]|uniref:hypothetical protein n=1 Tax=Olivibacter sp. SDN3 TaxID=2764720 RepID=UPI001651A284|nr:hypothetical protein [Olivibacter sp. SDN3]QNL48585.1 hypothetical protein H8S90_17585 [Olivibacter sp. SDN3]
MRAIAELPHKDCKISIFIMNQKFIIKFEQGALEQSYKISELDITDGVNGLFQLIDEPFINSVIERFKVMRTDFKATYDRHEY